MTALHQLVTWRDEGHRVGAARTTNGRLRHPALRKAGAVGDRRWRRTLHKPDEMARKCVRVDGWALNSRKTPRLYQPTPGFVIDSRVAFPSPIVNYESIRSRNMIIFVANFRMATGRHTIKLTRTSYGLTSLSYKRIRLISSAYRH